VKQEFLHIISENQGIIHKVCGIYCDTREDREDLFQEIVSQLWKSFPTFRHESKVSTWMYRVALNTAITQFKKEKRRPDQHAVEHQHLQYEDSYYDSAIEEEIKMLHKAISKLSGIEKSIVLLYLEEKKHEEIADIVGITQNYVRVKMNRIKARLKKIMEEDGHGT
jgi:RNA polymerase sigma-70 factor, ECF subfamily